MTSAVESPAAHSITAPLSLICAKNSNLFTGCNVFFGPREVVGLDHQRRNGILCGLTAFGLWGVMPLYFVAIRHVPPLEVLGQRIVWSVLLLAAAISALGRWEPVICCLRSPRIAVMFLASAVFLSGN